MIVNAAVTGLLPWLRYVFLSDGLLAQLSEEEVCAVFGHEMGHLRHRHLPLRIAAMLAPVSFWLLLCQIAPPLVEQLKGASTSGGAWSATQVALLTLMAVASYVLLVFGPYCRLLEGQADLFGCRSLAGDSSPQPIGTFIAALENLARTSGIDRNVRSWQHASIAHRVGFLERAAADPDCEVKFQRQVRSLSALILAVLISPLAWHLLMVAQRHAGTIQ
jgi:STE24 endopeptidase